MTGPLPPLTAGFGPQVVGPDGVPIYSSSPQNSAQQSPTNQMVYMPSGMLPAATPAGIMGSIGNTPMTDSMNALQQLLQQQADQNMLSTQILSQMHDTMRAQTKEITKDFSEMRRHTAEMTALQTQSIDHILTQIKNELGPGAAQAAGGGRHRLGEGTHPVDEGKVAQQGAQDADTATDAHPPDAPEATPSPAAATITTGHQRFGRRAGQQLPAGMSEPYATRSGGMTSGPIPPDVQQEPLGPIPQHQRGPAGPAGPTAHPGGAHGAPVRRSSGGGRADLSIPGVAQAVSGHLSQRLSDYESRHFDYDTDESGNITKVYRKVPTGPGPEDFTRAEAGPISRGVQGTVSGLGGKLGSFASEGRMGALLGPLEGPGGLIVGGAVMGVHQMQRQRQLNQSFQQATGGSFSSAFSNRIGQEGFSLRNMLTMPGSTAREIYQGVIASAPGQTEESRGAQSGALDFAVHQYRKTGMDVADSMNLIRTNIEHGVDSFNNLNTAITSVSDTAKGAGENSMMAIKNFSQMYGMLLGNTTGSGATASQIASTFTNLQTSWGRSAGLTSENFLGTTQGQGFMIGATAAGLNPINAQAQVAVGGAAGTRVQGQVTEGSYRTLWQDLGGQDLTDMAQQIAGSLNLSQDKSTGKYIAGSSDQKQVALQIVQERQLSPNTVISMASTLGLGTWSQDKAMQMLGALALNGGDIGATAEANKQASGGEAANHPTEINGQKIVTGQSTGQTNSATSQGKGIGAAGLTPANASKGEIALSKQTQELYSAAGTKSGEAEKYVQMVNSTGKRSAIAEALLKNEKSYKNKHFIVDTSSGEKEVSYQELFNSYKDQLVTGNVRDADTGNELSGADELNTPGTGGSLTTTKSAGRKAPKGAKDVSTTAGSGEVTIKPSDELARWFTFAASGGASIDQANRNGVPAPAFLPDPSQYPSATGN